MRLRTAVISGLVLVLAVATGAVTWRWHSTGGASRTSLVASPGMLGAAASPVGAAAPHVMLLVEENHSYDEVIGKPDMPFLNHLATTYGLATNYTGVAHPSEPNYLALVSGSVWDRPQDRTPASGTYPGPTLADQLAARGVGWKAYLEDMPTACDLNDAYGPGSYDVNHNPFVYFDGIRNSPAQCARDVPLGQLAGDLRNGTAPPFIYVAPNTVHDMHDGTPAEADAWLSTQLGAVMSSAWYHQGGRIVVTFDEGETTERIATVVVSEADRGAAPLTSAANHFGLLRSIEECYGLPLLGAAAEAANGDLSDLLR